MVIRTPSKAPSSVPQRPPASAASTLAWLAAAALCAYLPYQLYGVELAKSRQSRFWPSTTGRVTYFSSEHVLWRAGYAVHVWYAYKAKGEKHEGRRIGWGFATDLVATHAQVADLKRRYAVGRPVRVYFDPVAPDNARLEPASVYDPYATAYVVVGGAATLLLAGFAFGRSLPGLGREG